MRRNNPLNKIVLAGFAATAVFVGLLGMAAFGILMLDFQWPGLFKVWFVPRDNMAGNMALLVVFGVQHSIMARKRVKEWMSRVVPPVLVRSLYVLLSGFVLLLIAGLWSPTSPPLYDLRGSVWGMMLCLGAFSGFAIILWAGLLLGGLELIGVEVLRQLVAPKADVAELAFATPGPYRIVRHPIYFGFLLMFWLTPAMTHDHLLFAEVMTAYLLLGAALEERDLEKRFGKPYREYQKKVPMLIPFLRFPGGGRDNDGKAA